MKTFRWILICLLIFTAAGDFAPMTLMLAPGDPPYLFYTSVWNLTAGFLLLPPNLVASIFNIPGNHFLTYTLEAVWLFILIALAYYLPKTTSQKPPEQDQKS